MKPASPVYASARIAKQINLAGDTAEGYEALYIGVTGNVVVDVADSGTQITFVAVSVGFFPVAVTKIYSTANGTTAGSIVGLRW